MPECDNLSVFVLTICHLWEQLVACKVEIKIVLPVMNWRCASIFCWGFEVLGAEVRITAHIVAWLLRLRTVKTRTDISGTRPWGEAVVAKQEG